MAHPAKTSSPSASFEKAMERLEKIVEEMEAGELPLEQLIVRYEEGMKLVKVCQERLTAAEARIEIITRDSSSGKITVKDFAPTAAPESAAPASAPAPETAAEDISLF